MGTMQNPLLSQLRSLAAKQASSALSDPQLLEQFRTQRSETAFAALVRRHGPMVWNVCRRVLGNHHDAEDAFQAVFLVFVRQAATIRKQESISSFLHSIAYRIAVKLKATAARRMARERTQARPPIDDPCDDLTWRELRSVLDEELAKLSEQHRAPLVLCYLEGKTQDEAARLLGWSKNTFRRRLERGRATLARRLTSRGLTLPAALTAPLLIDGAAQAALPPLLAANTVRAGLAAAMGNTVNGLVSAQVIALAENATASLLTKKASIALILLASLTLGGGGLLAHRAVQDRSSAEAPPAPPPPARRASKDHAIEIKGRVLDPDGKPVAAAKVYVSTYTEKDRSDPKMRTKSDAEGRFRFTANPTEVDRNEIVVASAPGYGPDWVALKEIRNGKELALRLVKDDVPIKGRILDLEGRPVADAAVRLIRVLKMPGEDLTPWLKQMQTKSGRIDGRYFYDELMSSVWGLLDAPKRVKTDARGRFQLRGVGRNRLVLLRMEGTGIEHRLLMVMVRPERLNLRSFYEGPTYYGPTNVYGAAFDHLAAPSKRIRGTVRDKSSGKPLAGAHVLCNYCAGQSAVSDKEGRYEISGIGKSGQYVLSVSGPALVGYWKRVGGDTPGLEPLTVDFDVERGLAIRVRVREKGSGKPVQGRAEYQCRIDNPSLKSYTTEPRSWDNLSKTDKEGDCPMVVLPGPGYIAFKAKDGHFARSWLNDEHKVGNHDLMGVVPRGSLILELFDAVVPINPSSKDGKSLVIDIDLERGRRVSGTIVDPEGQPLSGTLVYGLRAAMTFHSMRESDFVLAAPRFTATGLDPQHPRSLVFYHAAKKLGKIVVVRGDEKEPLTVRLEPLGTVTGRLIDAQGQSLPGITVNLWFTGQQSQALPYEATIGGVAGGYQNPLLGKMISDKNGRFHIDRLIAGAKYHVILGENRAGKKPMLEPVIKPVAGKSGATVDVGEIKMKAPAEKKLSP